MSQPTVAKILGISSVAYSHKETGRTPFTLPEAKLLADTFDVTIDELFYGKVHVSHN
jgi:DNA-binding XRE family transcriptional regulator